MKQGAQTRSWARLHRSSVEMSCHLSNSLLRCPRRWPRWLRSESVEALDLKVGDQAQLIVKAIHVLPVKP